MKKLPISVCIIANEDAARIIKTLESVANWAGEIILLLNDTSHDGTDAAGEKFGAKVFREPWKGHIAQKNSAASKAAHSWLFGLDSDEAISPELQKEIGELFAAEHELLKFDGFSMPRCTRYYGRWIKHGDWYPDRKVRLWRKETGRWGGIDPHDKLEVNGNIGTLKGDILHYTAETITQQISKTIAYADDFARHAAETRKKVGVSDIMFRPCWRFCRGYLLKAGFLDGWQGYVISSVAAFYTLLRYLKAFEAQRDLNGKTGQ